MKIINGKQMPEVGDMWANKYIENKIVHVFDIYISKWFWKICMLWRILSYEYGSNL